LTSCRRRSRLLRETADRHQRHNHNREHPTHVCQRDSHQRLLQVHKSNTMVESTP
jgi:hypothetical protein